jgi:hypothetical protein
MFIVHACLRCLYCTYCTWYTSRFAGYIIDYGEATSSAMRSRAMALSMCHANLESTPGRGPLRRARCIGMKWDHPMYLQSPSFRKARLPPLAPRALSEPLGFDSTVLCLPHHWRDSWVMNIVANRVLTLAGDVGSKRQQCLWWVQREVRCPFWQSCTAGRSSHSRWYWRTGGTPTSPSFLILPA